MQVQNKQTITIDLKKNSIIQLPKFIQNDTNIIDIKVKENDADADLSNITRIVANYKRPDKVVVSRLLTATGNTVTYEIGIEEMQSAGYGEIEIQFFQDEKRISTKRFKVYMVESIGTDKIYEGTSLTLLQELFVEVSDVKASGDYAKDQGDYAKAQGDSAKTNWLAPVANYAAIATTYSAPKIGDTVQCLDNGYVYRYSGSQWVYTQGYSATAIADVNTKLAQKVSKVNGASPDANGNVTIEVPQVDTSNLATKTDIQNIGSATPKGVYATLSALQTAFPTGTTGVYLVTADGKWYYWNGSAWTAGGTYQSTGLAANSVNDTHLSSLKSSVAVNDITDLIESSKVPVIESSLRLTNTIINGTLNATKTSGTYAFLKFALANTLVFTVTDKTMYVLYKRDGTANTGECVGVYGANFGRRLNLDFNADTGATIDYLTSAQTVAIGDTLVVKLGANIDIYRLVNGVENLVFSIAGANAVGFVIAGSTMGDIATNIRDALLTNKYKLQHLFNNLTDPLTVADRISLLSDTVLNNDITVFGATYRYNYDELNILSRPNNWGAFKFNSLQEFSFIATSLTKYFIYKEDADWYYFYELTGANKGYWHTLNKTSYVHNIDYAKTSYTIENDFAVGDKLVVAIYNNTLYLINRTKNNIVLRITDYNCVGFGLGANGAIANKIRTIKSDYLVSDILLKDVNNNLKKYAAKQGKWSGKKWAVIGDSITEVNAKTTSNYHKYIADDIGCTVLNYGISGTGWRNPSADVRTDYIYNRISTVDSTADLITVFAGTNDNAEVGAKPFVLGALGDTDPSATFYGAVDNVITQLIAKFPTKTIAVFTPLPRDYADTAFGTATYTKMEQISKAIIDVCNKYSIPVLDLLRNSNMYPSNLDFKTAMMPDGLHPNATGHRVLADKILTFLNTL